MMVNTRGRGMRLSLCHNNAVSSALILEHLCLFNRTTVTHLLGQANIHFMHGTLPGMDGRHRQNRLRYGFIVYNNEISGSNGLRALKQNPYIWLAAISCCPHRNFSCPTIRRGIERKQKDSALIKGKGKTAYPCQTLR